MSSTTPRHRHLATAFGLAAAISLTIACTSQAPAPQTVPVHTPAPLAPVPGDGANFLLVTADDATATDLDHMPLTKRLLGESGTTFTSGLAPTPICVPARASLATGQYATNHGALSIKGRHGSVTAFDDADTLPVWLNTAGYETAFVGKYLNGYGHVTDRTYIPPGWSNWQGSIDYATYDFSRTVVNNNGRIERGDVYNTDAFADRVDEFLADPARSGRPWYMWANYVAPHNGGPGDIDDPTNWPKMTDGDDVKTTQPADRHRDLFDGVAIPKTPSLFRTDPDKAFGRGALARSGMNRRAVTESYQQRLESLQAVDEAIASHVQTLAETGQLDDTYIVFTSDNGYFTGQHNLVGKLLWYEEALKVPMVMRGPGIPAGHVSTTPVTSVDLPVTVAAVAGATPTRNVDGTDIRALLDDDTATQRVVPISAWPVKTRNTTPVYTGVRVGNDWTYVRTAKGVEELFDLAGDPNQLHNIASDPGYADVLDQMRTLNKEHHE